MFPSLKDVFPHKSCFDNFAFYLSHSQFLSWPLLLTTLHYFPCSWGEWGTVGVEPAVHPAHHLQNVLCLSLSTGRGGAGGPCWNSFHPSSFLLTECNRKLLNSMPDMQYCQHQAQSMVSFCKKLSQDYTRRYQGVYVQVCSHWDKHAYGPRQTTISSCPYLLCLQLQSLPGN